MTKPTQTQLDLIVGQIGKQQPKELQPIAEIPKCPICFNWGYTGADHVRRIRRQLPEDFLSLAFRDGIACSCAAGRQFALDQAEWNRESAA